MSHNNVKNHIIEVVKVGEKVQEMNNAQYWKPNYIPTLL